MEEVLRKLGMAEEEAKLYLAFLENPGASLPSISEKLGIPTKEAERAVADMIEAGILRAVPGKELCFDAEDPSKVLRLVLERERIRMEKLYQEKEELAKKLGTKLSALFWERRLGLKPEDIVEPLVDLKEMELRTVRMMEEAQEEVLVFTRSFGWYSKVKEAIMCARDKGVDVRVLMKVVDRASARRARELLQLGARVRQCREEWYPLVGTIVDREELIFLIWAVDKTKAKRPVYYRPHYTRNPGLVTVFLEAFEKRWREATPIEEGSPILKRYLG